jgi:hypothetical protein
MSDAAYHFQTSVMDGKFEFFQRSDVKLDMDPMSKFFSDAQHGCKNDYLLPTASTIPHHYWRKKSL